MKTDLTNTTFIIHYRKDVPDRAFNLKSIYRFLEENINYKELIIINDNDQMDVEMEQFKKLKGNIIPLFFENTDHFKKSSCFNIAATYATGKVLCFYDVDVLINPSNLKKAQDQILNLECDHIYPFNGTFFNIKKDFFPRFLETFDFEILLSNRESEYLEFASNISPGGCNMISQEAFKRLKGYDESFIGWGFEDTDFQVRSRKIKLCFISIQSNIFINPYPIHFFYACPNPIQKF